MGHDCVARRNGLTWESSSSCRPMPPSGAVHGCLTPCDAGLPCTRSKLGLRWRMLKSTPTGGIASPSKKDQRSACGLR